MCSKGIYYNVYHFKNKVTIRSGQRDVTVKHVERGSENEMAGTVMSENKNNNFTKKLLFLFNSENPVIHSYLYNISIYHIAVDKIAKIKFYSVSFA